MAPESHWDLDLPPRKKPKLSRYFPAFLAWFLIIGATVVYFVFPGTGLISKFTIAVPMVHGLVVAILLANLAVATYMDPGFLPKALPDEIPADEFRAPLYKSVEIKGVQVRLKWCVTCNLYRPPRTSHCSTCNRCIEVFDHHCPWVANCVGRRNYRYFLYFLISLCIHMVAVLAGSVYQVITEGHNLVHPVQIASLVLIVLCGLLIFPIGGLTCFHFHLVSKANTTNEQVTSKFKNSVNPYDRGCLRNCTTIFCGPLYGKFRTPGELTTVVVQKAPERLPFSPSASPTQVRVNLRETEEKIPNDVSVRYQVPALSKPKSSGYAFKPSSPEYDNVRPLQPVSPLVPNPPPVPSASAPEIPNPKPSSLIQSSMKSKMQPVIAELVARAPSASLSSTEGYGSVDESMTMSSYSNGYKSNTSIIPPKISDNPNGRSTSRQDSYLTSSGASTASTTDRTSVDLHQKMFRAVDGRFINSPRHSTRKSKAYGNVLKEDVGGTMRASRGDDVIASDPKEKILLSSAKAVSTSNLTQETPLVMYKKNPAMISQPSLTVLDRVRNPRPPSFVQALETTDSIEQLTLLGKGPVNFRERENKRREKMKGNSAVYGEISV